MLLVIFCALTVRSAGSQNHRAAAGFHANAALPVDPQIKNIRLADLTEGSAVLYDTTAKLVMEQSATTS